ncbi:MAG: hypothetical protein JNK74_10390 [Candidatus Hydrogenedentes bacterium]|nr:hypothetical protein [Candidatus Hydrogenedentota bacterium]
MERLTTIERMVTFFAMQRYLYKWGGEYESRQSRGWQQFRELFLSIAECDVPEPYRDDPLYLRWCEEFIPRLQECIHVVREIHESTEYLNHNIGVYDQKALKTFSSIKALVLDFVQRNEGKVNYAELTKEVLHHFPDSKWKPTHWSYWRYQILHSALAGQFTREALANLKVGVQKSPSIIPPELPKPTWPNLIELEQHNIAKALARVTHHMHPKVIARIREINSGHVERARLEAILPECIEREAWFYPGSACVFPGVRRFVGRVKKKQLLKYVPKEACIIDDNRFPRNLWTFLAIGEHYTGPNWKNSGLSDFELAHIFSHKHEKQELEWEVFKEHDKKQKPYGLFTCASNVVLIPKGFAKPTDGLPAVRVAFFKRHIELYGEDCLPGLRGLDPEAIPGWYDDLEWNEPSLPPRWEENVDKLVAFRYAWLAKLLSDHEKLGQC